MEGDPTYSPKVSYFDVGKSKVSAYGNETQKSVFVTNMTFDGLIIILHDIDISLTILM